MELLDGDVVFIVLNMTNECQRKRLAQRPGDTGLNLDFLKDMFELYEPGGETPLSHRPKQIHPKQIPQAKEVPKSMSPSKQDPENHIPKHTTRKIHPQAKKYQIPKQTS